MNLGDRFVSDQYAIIVGPAHLDQPTPSWAVDNLEEYPVSDVLATLLRFPGARQTSSGGRDGCGWEAIWESEQRMIILGEVEELDDEGHLGCISLVCDCLVEDLLRLWEFLRKHYPGLWLYSPESWLQTRDSFLAGG